MDDLTDEEISAFRDLMEFWAGSAQAATGYYGSGGDVPRDRVASARASVAHWLTKYPGIREELKVYIESERDRAGSRFKRKT